MVDCGFVNLIEEPNRKKLRAGMNCARNAFESGKSFRYGSVRIPIDSYAHEVLIRSADGTLWFLVHDRMLGDDDAQYWEQKCRKLTFKPRNAGFEIDCTTDKESS